MRYLRTAVTICPFMFYLFQSPLSCHLIFISHYWISYPSSSDPPNNFAWNSDTLGKLFFFRKMCSTRSSTCELWPGWILIETGTWHYTETDNIVHPGGRRPKKKVILISCNNKNYIGNWETTFNYKSAARGFKLGDNFLFHTKICWPCSRYW
jgi:hypothetical protein